MLDEFYEVLDVPRNSSFPEVLFAYKQLLSNLEFERTTALSDQVASIDQRMARIAEAFNALKDPLVRALYDKSSGVHFQRARVLSRGSLIRRERPQGGQGQSARSGP